MAKIIAWVAYRVRKPICFKCLIWMRYPLNTDSPCLSLAIDERLDRRVDQMLLTGLIDELRDFHLRFNRQKIQDQRWVWSCCHGVR